MARQNAPEGQGCRAGEQVGQRSARAGDGEMADAEGAIFPQEQKDQDVEGAEGAAGQQTGQKQEGEQRVQTGGTFGQTGNGNAQDQSAEAPGRTEGSRRRKRSTVAEKESDFFMTAFPF